MTDLASLKAALTGVDAVVHLAALKSDEKDVVAVNVGGARNLAEACRAAGVKRVINIGSQSSRMARRGDYGNTKAESDAWAASPEGQATFAELLGHRPNRAERRRRRKG